MPLHHCDLALAFDESEADVQDRLEGEPRLAKTLGVTSAMVLPFLGRPWDRPFADAG